ncbi:Branched-chain amino acid transport protein AzlD [Lachnospiraceae bacterium NK3A20]|nr:Branched-chain amino acid transport protein AzlD [Lachnospiraceae bacterium NK3A20]
MNPLSRMSDIQIMITILCALGATVITRFLPYILFPEGCAVPKFVQYLGRFLAPAVFGLLVVHCLRNVDLVTAFAAGGSHGIPEIAALLVVTVSFIWKRSMMLSMAAGTVLYMFLVQVVF